MLRRLRLVDFKSFADEAVEFAPLTLLVGANASGKSNCMDALRFLHETVVDESIVEILDGEQRPGAGPNAWQGLRGGSKEASRIGAESFLIESTWDIPEVPAMHRIRCRTVPRPTWDEEGIYTDDARTLLVARAIVQGREARGASNGCPRPGRSRRQMGTITASCGPSSAASCPVIHA